MFTFRPLTEADLPLVREWIARPHVAEWWNGEMDIYDDGTRQFIAFLEDVSFAYVQVYIEDLETHGIDQFIAVAANLGRGLGAQLVKESCELVFADERVLRIRVDPAPGNARAIRCYEKAGFRREQMIDTADGPALLMFLRR